MQFLLVIGWLSICEFYYYSMEEADVSCASASPLVRIIPMKPRVQKKPSHFAVLHKDSKQSDGTYFEERDPNDETPCRICLSAGGGGLLKPCKCEGAVEFAHEGCLREWIRGRAEKGEKRVCCEACLGEYNYHQEESKEVDCAQLGANWRGRRGEVCGQLLLVGLALVLFIAATTITAVASNAEGAQRARLMPTQTVTVAYAAAIVVCCIFLAIAAAQFVKEYCVRVDYMIRVRKYVPSRYRSARSVRRSRDSIVVI